KIAHPRRDFSGDLVEKTYLLGFRQGDLHVNWVNEGGRTIRVECASTRREQIDLIEGLFQSYGHIVLCGPYKGGRVSIQCLLNPTFDFLLPKQDGIEDWILADDRFFAAFLAGYTDAEGCMAIYNGKAAFFLASGDRRIILQIYNKLSSQGIELPKPILWINRGYTRRYKDRQTTIRKDLWRLNVHRKQALLALFDLLTPYLKHAKRRRDMEWARVNIEERNCKQGTKRPKQTQPARQI
ncbi:MAG: LAGLIDADG family homing endonuclease, partial [Anaerolineae bacterium]|nr:LAGLIDADG family homing endonuclease [Anaerolineae bacterium]